MKLFTLLLSISILFCGHAYAQSSEDVAPPTENESVPRQEMTQSRMADIIKGLVDETQDSGNSINFVYDEVAITLVSDATANRMRLVSPVIEASNMSEQQIIASLVSNYHLALDARYAIGSGVLFSTYIHPLAELTESQLISAVRQVATLSKTFGTTYTSGELSFGVQAEEEERIEI